MVSLNVQVKSTNKEKFSDLVMRKNRKKMVNILFNKVYANDLKLIYLYLINRTLFLSTNTCKTCKNVFTDMWYTHDIKRKIILELEITFDS